ncbi:MAG: hypothetical protein ACMXYC_03350, partial [Candidatus Woesearchaeota archaeon]
VAEKERLNTGVFDPSRCTVYPRSWPSIERIGAQGTRNTAFAYVVCRLNRYPPQAAGNITEGYKTLEDMQFAGAPLLIEVLYDTMDANGEKRSSSQQMCYDAKVYFDRRLPPGAIPEDFLNVSVQVLDATIEAIDMILKPLRTITLATTGACLATHVGYFLQTSQMEYQCLGKQDLIPALRQGISGVPHSQADNMINAICDEVDEAKRQKEGGNEEYNKGLGDLKLSELTGDCRACGQAIKRNVQIQKYFTTVCDRIYCPPTPSGQKYVRDNNENQFSACSVLHTQAAVDEFSQRSKSPQSEFLGPQTGFNKEDGCGYEYYSQYGSSCLGYRLLAGHDIVQASINNAQRNQSPSFNAILDRATNFDFCAANEAQDDIAFAEGDQWYIRDEDDPNCFRLGGPETREAVIDARKSGQVYLNQSSQRQGVSIYRTVNGFTNYEENQKTYSDCVRTDPQGNMYFVPKDTQGRTAYFDRERGDTMAKEFNGQQIEVQDIGGGRFIGPDDTIYLSPNRDNKVTLYTDSHIYRTNAKVGSGVDYHLGKPEGFSENEKEVVQGPDRLRGRPAPDYLIRSPTSFMNSLRCGCLPALSSYLQQIRNILNLIRTCFMGILVTKEFNSGMCRAVLTQYVCDWIFEALGCFIRAASMSDDQLSADTGRINAVQYGLTSIGRAGRTTQQYASGRYGDSQNFQALFTQRKLLNAICLAALGYDWLPDLEAAIGMDGQFPIATMAVVQPASRTYLSANPTQGGLATFSYHIGYLVNAGEDINYRIELVCSDQPICHDYASHEGGMCDCAHGSMGNVQTAPANWGAEGGGFNTEQTRVIRTGFVRAGQLQDDEIYINVESPVRYDRVRISWFPANSRNPPGSEDRRIREAGMIPLMCSFDLARVQFRCGTSFGDDGSAHFIRPPTIDGIGTYNLGESIRFNAHINLIDGQGPRALPHYLRIEVRDHDNNVVFNRATSKGELQNGTQSYPRQPIQLNVIREARRSFTISNPPKNALLASSQTILSLPADFPPFVRFIYNASKEKYKCEAFEGESTTRAGECVVQQGRVAYAGVLFTLNSSIRDGSAIVFTSNISTQLMNTNLLSCPPGQDTVQWKATLSLHGSIRQDVGRELTWENSVMNNEPLTFNDHTQQHEVSFLVRCNQQAPERLATTNCAPNEVLSGTCNCGGFNCHSGHVCSSKGMCYNVPAEFLQYVDVSTTVTDGNIKDKDHNPKRSPDKLTPLQQNGVEILAAYCGGIPAGTQLKVVCFADETCISERQNFWCRNEPSN